MSTTTHRIDSSHIHTYWSRDVPPALTVAPGDTVVFETLEASFGGVARNVREWAGPDVAPDLIEIIAADAYPERPQPDRDPSITGGHAMTGPVAIDGAEPGDTLVVEIVNIEPAAWGYNSCSPRSERLGLLNDALDIETEAYHYWDLRARYYADFKPGIRVPFGPHPGVMGVALDEPGQFSTIPPRHNGGNMDIRHLTNGATLYLPVLAPGALFSTGDVHFAMGDGEVTGTGIEMNANVTLRFDVQKGRTIPGAQLRTNGEPLSIPGPAYATTGHNPDVREAAREALRAMLDYMGQEYGLSRAEAYMLASVVVDLKISQIVDRPNWTVTAYLPLSIFTG